MLNANSIKELVNQQFGEANLIWDESSDILTVTIPKEQNLKLLQYLYDTPALSFKFLTDICAVHYPDQVGAELCVVYHLQNLEARLELRVKVTTSSDNPTVYTATALFPGANWMERETYDFFGVQFLGHPNLKRILNVDEMDYFPLRKQYPLEDQTRTDKDDEMFGRGGTYH